MQAATWIRKLGERVTGVLLLVCLAPSMMFLAIIVTYSTGGRVLVRRRIRNAGYRTVEVFAFETWSHSGRKLIVGQLMDQYSSTDLPMVVNVARGEIGLAELKESFRRTTKAFWPRS